MLIGADPQNNTRCCRARLLLKEILQTSCAGFAYLKKCRNHGELSYSSLSDWYTHSQKLFLTPKMCRNHGKFLKLILVCILKKPKKKCELLLTLHMDHSWNCHKFSLISLIKDENGFASPPRPVFSPAQTCYRSEDNVTRVEDRGS